MACSWGGPVSCEAYAQAFLHLLDGIDLNKAGVFQKTQASYAKMSVKYVDHIPWSVSNATHLAILLLVSFEGVEDGKRCLLGSAE